MGNSYGRITAPVNTDDVASVIGVNSHDVTTLCISDRVNKWAKYKPEIHATPASIALSQRQTNNFGLQAMETYTSQTAFINAVKAGTFTGGWKYNQPKVGDWCRLDDFVGYNHQAKSPFGTLKPFTGFLSNSTLISLLIPAESPEESPDDDMGILSIKEFLGPNADYKNWYFGILLYSASRTFMATTASPIGILGDWQVDFGWINPNYAGTYKGVPFLSSSRFTVSGSLPTDQRIVGVGQSGVTVSLKKVTDIYIPFATVWYVDSFSYNTSYVVSITNHGTTDRTFTSVVLQIAQSESGTNAISFVSFGSVTVKAGQVWRQTGSKATTSRAYNWCRLWYSGANAPWVNFEEIDQGEYDG